MYFYLFIILFLAVLIYLYDIMGTRRNRSFWERFVLVSLIVIVGLRYHIGSDTVVYEWNFDTSATPRLDEFFNSEAIVKQPLWLFVMSFCKTVFGTFVAVQFFHAIVFHLLAFRFIKKTTPYTFTALLFLFVLLWFANSFEVLRESIASVIFLNSLFFFQEKKYLKYALCGIVATGFHVFASVLFILSFLVGLSNKKVLAVTCLFLYVIAQVIDFSVVNNMVMAVLSVSGSLADKAQLYVGVENSSVVSLLGIFRWLVLDLFLPLCVIILSYKKNELFVKLVIFWLMLSQLTSKLPILYRMDNYYELIYIVLLVNVLYDVHGKKRYKRIRLYLDGGDAQRPRVHRPARRRWRVVFFRRRWRIVLRGRDGREYQLFQSRFAHTLRRRIGQLRPILVALSVFVLVMGYRDVCRPDMNFQSAQVSYDIRYFPYKTIFQDPDPLREAQKYY